MVQVIAKKVDNKSLILENPLTGETMTWPLDKIHEPLEIGDKLTLQLVSESSSNTVDRKEDNDETLDRRKLLENLIN